MGYGIEKDVVLRRMWYRIQTTIADTHAHLEEPIFAYPHESFIAAILIVFESHLK